jgi:hypothetical protein
VRTEIALAQIELSATVLEEIDIEGVLGFAEHLLSNAARLWTEATSEQNRRLQAVFFPKKLRFANGELGTAVTCMAFSQLRSISTSNDGMASQSLPSWNQIVDFLRQMRDLQESAGFAA